MERSNIIKKKSSKNIKCLLIYNKKMLFNIIY